MPALGSKALGTCVWIWIFSGGLIFFEPSLYEFLFMAVLCVAAMARMPLFVSTTPLFFLLFPFSVSALIAGLQVRYGSPLGGFVYIAVTIYLLLTAFFVANFVAGAPERHIKIIRRAYLWIAMVSATIGVLAYLGLLPSADLFLLHGRARAMFKDPNVYGPFLVLPAMFLLRDLFFEQRSRLLNGALLLMLTVGVFVSFSRAAWGHLAVSGLLVFAMCFWLEAKAAFKVRMLVLALVGTLVLAITFVGLLSIPEVASLFEQRASMSQSYDTGSTGRFGRQGYAFDLALTHPWGLGPGEFRHLRIQEDPHNTYVNVLHAYGWGGGFCYYLLVFFTLWRGIVGMKNPAIRGALIPVMAVYVPLVIQAGIIDTDHWRHYFLVVGLIWGLTANTAIFGLRLPVRRRLR